MTQVWDMQRREWFADEIPISQWRFAPILPILFYTGGREWNAPISIATLMDLPADLMPFIPQHEVLRFDLKRKTPESLTSDGHPVSWALSVLQQEEASFDDFAASLRTAISALEPLEGLAHNHWEQLMYFLVLLIYHRRGEPERQPLLQVVEQNVQDQRHREEVTEMGLTAAEFIRQQTQRQTQRQTEQRILIKQLEIKFGSLPTRVYQAIRDIEAEDKLNVLLYQIPTASTLAEIESVLNGETG